MKKLIITWLIIGVYFACTSVHAFTGDLSYTIARESASAVFDCAYNGIIYVVVGEKGFIAVSEDLTNWTEVSNVCYSDINKILWDGSQFVFISNYNVYRSYDGYNWTGQSCKYSAGNDFAFINGKYLVRNEEGTLPMVSVTVGLTSDFNDFEEIAINPEGVSLINAFAPQIYVLNDIYFALGRTKNILWSQDMKTWNIMPLLNNEEDTTRKRLLFTYINGEYILYFYERNTLVRYAINSLENGNWSKTIVDISGADKDATLLHTGGKFYYFINYNAYASNDGINFERMTLPSKGYVGVALLVNDKIVDFSKGAICWYDAETGNWLENDGIAQNIHQEPFVENLYWTGKEYIRRNLETGIIEMTTDKVHFYDSGITAENYQAFWERYAYKIQWTGKHYLVTAEYGGNKIWLYDELLNLVDEHTFDGDIMDLAFSNETYYVRLGSVANKVAFAGVYSSRNFKDWSLEKNLIEAPKSNGKSTILTEREYTGLQTYISQTDVTRVMYEVNNLNFAEIAYETKTTIPNIQVIGDMYVKRTVDSNGNLSFGFSNDGVYFVEIPIQGDFAFLANTMYNGTDKMFYILGDKIIYNQSGWYITFDINEIRNAINIENPTYVRVGDKILGFDTPPIIENDRTLVPLRFIFETLGAKVDWDGETQSALVEGSNKSIMFSINDTNARVNDQIKQMDVPARLIDSKTMVPLRFLSEELGFTVSWDEGNRIATISE